MLGETGSLNGIIPSQNGYVNPVYQSKVSLNTATRESDSIAGSKNCLFFPSPNKKANRGRSNFNNIKCHSKKEFYQLVYLSKLNETYGTIERGDIKSITYDKSGDLLYKESSQPFTNVNNKSHGVADNKRQKSICFHTYWNIITLALSLMCLYSAFISLKSLQSSIHYGYGEIGIISLCCIYGAGFFSCLIGPSVIKQFGHKYVLSSSILLFLVYTACNMLPEEHLYFIIPASAVLGIAKGFLWITTSAFITQLAIHYSKQTNSDIKSSLCKFNGIFYSIYSTAQIWAHVISSVVLTLSENNSSAIVDNDYSYSLGYHPITVTGQAVNGSEVTLALYLTQQSSDMAALNPQQQLKDSNKKIKCGGQFVLNEDIKSTASYELITNESSGKITAPLRPLQYKTWLVLCSIYILLTLLSVIIIFAFLKKLKHEKIDDEYNKDETAVSSQLGVCFEDKESQHQGLNVKKRHVGVCKVLSLFKDPRMQLLVPLILFTAFKEVFVFSDYTKHYVFCAIGLHGIGLTMICYGLLSTIGSLFIGLVVKHIKSYAILAAGALFETGNMMVLMWWRPHVSDVEVFYVMAASMGLCDAIWKTQINVLLGILFQDSPEEAFSLHRMVFYAGLSLAFGCSQFLMIRTKIYIIGAFLLVGLGMYAVVHVKCIPKVKNSAGRVALRLVPMM